VTLAGAFGVNLKLVPTGALAAIAVAFVPTRKLALDTVAWLNPGATSVPGGF
jgi:hypothetical protein